MLEPHPGMVIPQVLVLARLAHSEQVRDFFIQMWLQNPALAERAGRRMRDILSPAHRPSGSERLG